MKILKTIICGLCLLSSLLASAQTRKSVSDLPYSNKFEVSSKTLESLFQTSDTVSMELTPGFRIEGNIENKTVHSPAITSILVKLSTGDNAPQLPVNSQRSISNGGILSITRYRDQNGKTYYSGQLLKLHEPDGMLLVAEDQHYYFIETQQRFLVSE
jgi:hypothetical protein